MNIENTQFIYWDREHPFDLNTKISKDIRAQISYRFDSALADLRDFNQLGNFVAENGWIYKVQNKNLTSLEFVITPSRMDNLPVNSEINPIVNIAVDSKALRKKVNNAAIKIWDCETYTQLSNIVGVSLNSTNGKISYKVI